ncbi:MAG: hypothetical protein R2860_16780 [Desulfobacterales bacterium]
MKSPRHRKLPGEELRLVLKGASENNLKNIDVNFRAALSASPGFPVPENPLWY